jgi:hypothetical protein
MRRVSVLLVAAVAALSPLPAASAHGAPPAEDASASCPPPDVVQDYDTERFSVFVTLPAIGCPARENRPFSLSAWVSRVDEKTGEGTGRMVNCGPFQSSDDMDPDEVRTYSCEIALSLVHPAVEAADYEVEVTYPGADRNLETITFESFCVSNDAGTSCSDEHPAK